MRAPFFGLLNPFALLCGLVSVAMLAMHGGAYLALKASGAIVDRALRIARIVAPVTIALFIVGGIWVALRHRRLRRDFAIAA